MPSVMPSLFKELVELLVVDAHGGLLYQSDNPRSSLSMVATLPVV